ncbi:ubiquitin-conjugating enzyme E2 D [Pancytospora philotis]|nr:ubiquitin-conjugating enzyme E2 D [Pancytospora philotis]
MTSVNSTTEKRIKKEMNQCAKLNNKEIRIEPCIDGNMYKWKAFIYPSKTSVYHDTVLEMSIVFPATYPYAPPGITFVSPIFHPNVNTNGSICISTLGKDWSPALTVEKTLLSIMSLLDEPNASDPLRPEAAELYLCGEKAYYERVRQECEKAGEELDEQGDPDAQKDAC